MLQIHRVSVLVIPKKHCEILRALPELAKGGKIEGEPIGKEVLVAGSSEELRTGLDKVAEEITDPENQCLLLVETSALCSLCSVEGFSKGCPHLDGLITKNKSFFTDIETLRKLFEEQDNKTEKSE